MLKKQTLSCLLLSCTPLPCLANVQPETPKSSQLRSEQASQSKLSAIAYTMGFMVAGTLMGSAAGIVIGRELSTSPAHPEAEEGLGMLIGAFSGCFLGGLTGTVAAVSDAPKGTPVTTDNENALASEKQ